MDWSFLEQIIVSEVLKTFTDFCGTKGSLLCSHEYLNAVTSSLKVSDDSLLLINNLDVVHCTSF
jgi:hypothetical protein